MAREFAKKFYRSKSWQECRDYIFKKYYGLCAECGKPGEEVHHIKHLNPNNINDPNITTAEDNLILLCKNCHFSKHRDTNPLHENFKDKKKRKIKKGFYFDNEGNLVKTKVYIIHGAPASGKSSYVAANKSKGDLIIDLDLIMQAISMEDKSDIPYNLLDTAISIRDYIYKLIEQNEIDTKCIWILGMLPKVDDRQALADRLGAELIHINVELQECMRRAKHDENRSDKRKQYKIIEKYFADYQM